MKIIVKRFCLAHNGEIYKAGDVVEIADPQTAKRLVARSGGDLEIYHGDETEDVEDTDNDDGDVGDGGASDDVPDSDSEDGVGGIPAIDPAAAVQTDGEPAKKKSRGKKK
jgi:hypothetical protein|nr:MAG TPA: hypothetical protein [Caudoviricetes sp.]